MNNEKTLNNEKEARKSIKRVSTQVVKRFVPMVVIFMILILGTIYFFVSKTVKKLIYNSLDQQVAADSGQINKQLNSTFYYLNGIANSTEAINFQSNDEILDYFSSTVKKYDMVPTGIYMGVNDGSYLDASGWQPDAGYNVLTTKWYQQGMGYNDSYFYYYDVPYFDSATGNLCATVIRHVKLKDGREGVIAADLMMETAQKYLNSVKVLDSGKAMMTTGNGMILSYSNKKICGKTLASQKKDKLLTAVNSLIKGKDNTVKVINGADGQYYAIAQTVIGN
jgi:methyl-accepting chemotaxis protein